MGEIKSCLGCFKWAKCVKLCPAINRILKEEGIYGAEYIRPEVSKNKQKDGMGRFREVPFSSLGKYYQAKVKKTIGDNPCFES